MTIIFEFLTLAEVSFVVIESEINKGRSISDRMGSAEMKQRANRGFINERIIIFERY